MEHEYPATTLGHPMECGHPAQPWEKPSAELSQEGIKMSNWRLFVCLLVSNLQNADMDSYGILPMIN